MPPLLSVQGLVKQYGTITAVDHVDLNITAGCCFGLLGPNGAGKTTVLEIIEDIRKPTAGQILYRGKPRRASFREEIGIQFQDTRLPAYLTVQETLQIFRQLYQRPMTLESVLELCDLTPLANRRHSTLSGGQRQRLLLALALINQPCLLLLDEPSAGLDPQARHNLWDLILRIKNNGRTILLTTHSMQEAQHLCDQIAILDQGRVIAQGTVPELLQTHCPETTIRLPRCQVHAPYQQLPAPWQILHEQLELRTTDVAACLRRLLQMNIALDTLHIHQPTLEDVFLKLTGRHLRD